MGPNSLMVVYVDLLGLFSVQCLGLVEIKRSLEFAVSG